MFVVAILYIVIMIFGINRQLKIDREKLSELKAKHKKEKEFLLLAMGLYKETDGNDILKKML